jgi:hypothetical protein
MQLKFNLLSQLFCVNKWFKILYFLNIIAKTIQEPIFSASNIYLFSPSNFPPPKHISLYDKNVMVLREIKNKHAMIAGSVTSSGRETFTIWIFHQQFVCRQL